MAGWADFRIMVRRLRLPAGSVVVDRWCVFNPVHCCRYLPCGIPATEIPGAFFATFLAPGDCDCAASGTIRLDQTSQATATNESLGLFVTASSWTGSGVLGSCDAPTGTGGLAVTLTVSVAATQIGTSGVVWECAWTYELAIGDCYFNSGDLALLSDRPLVLGVDLGGIDCPPDCVLSGTGTGSGQALTITLTE